MLSETARERKRIRNREWQRARRADPEVREREREAAAQYRADHPDRVADALARYRDTHREDVNRQARERYAADPAKAADWQRRYQQTREGAAMRRESGRRWRAKVRAEVFAHYGEQCACCSARTQLTIDHIDGNGSIHRDELRPGGQPTGARFYAWLRRHGFPPGYQTLCLPCNRSKGTGARCRMHT